MTTDLHLRDEEDYIQAGGKHGDIDVIYADPCMKRMTPEFAGIFVDTIHFAVSGRLAEDERTVAGCPVRCDSQ